jgi:hypothetical protein
MSGPPKGGRLGGMRSVGLTADDRIMFGRLHGPPIHVERDGRKAVPHPLIHRLAPEGARALGRAASGMRPMCGGSSEVDRLPR